MGGRTFDCLEAVINRYKTEQIVEGHTLGHYIKRVRLPISLYIRKRSDRTALAGVCLFFLDRRELKVLRKRL